MCGTGEGVAWITLRNVSHTSYLWSCKKICIFVSKESLKNVKESVHVRNLVKLSYN
jgi:hypothetical protein